MYAIEVSDLNVKFGDQQILSNVNFKLQVKKFHTVIGPNGGGKTTLIKAILNLIPFDGEIRIMGMNNEDYLRNKFIGYVSQYSNLYKDFPITVYDVIEMGLMKERNKKYVRERIFEVLKFLDISDLHGKKINELSGGQRQKVFIARAIISNPEILIMDEPTVGLDIKAQKEFYEMIKRLIEEKNLTVIIASHDIGFVSEYADTVMCINKKLVIHGDEPTEITSLFFKRLYGYPVKTIIHKHKSE